MQHLPLPSGNKIFVGGQWVASAAPDLLDVINPTTEQVIGHCASSSAADVDAAVGAAAAASPAWGQLSGAQRAQWLRRVAKAVEADTPRLAALESLDMGKPIAESIWDMEDVAGAFNYYADHAEALDRRQDTPVKLGHDQFRCKLRYDPVGVVAIIVPWNYPLLMATWKIAPAIAAGCTVVLKTKPSEHSSLTALALADIIRQIGFPAGVVNVVTGLGPTVGHRMVSHPLVDAVAFTGSSATGSAIMATAAKAIRQCSLELGGKSSLIVFDDVDVEQAVEWIMFGVFWTNGQICSSTSRVLLHRNIADRVMQRLKEETERIVLGDPLDESSKMGPLVNRQQYEKVMRYIKLGKEQASLVTGGGRSPAHPSGYFVQPTIFTVPADSTSVSIWNDEIFGPVLAVKIFDQEQEAVREANNTPYGLAGAVMSKDRQRCDRVARALKAGIVWINCSQPCFVEAPWGGRGRSGIGRDLGQFGFDRFLEVKQVTSYESRDAWGWFIPAKL